MLDDLKILNVASAMARHAAQRHGLIAENIANADTAGYRAKDLEAFGEAYARRARLDGAADRIDWRVVKISAPGLESPNGNNVSLEDQMLRAAEAKGAHDAATAIYKKTVDILRASLRRQV
ncbi:FlgB family protein [Amphiplicatus metriothermophilus]|uniref:Flagellar basal-body rod protein FlgB n=1 Tax=Amphiplicatus metriothermophilus TaxID=1519374 RepID=A0A239PMK5_9PROT|nr:FlgB family protein [Amphiplicatus metriothermophilus]MBB5517330.1 flagellar basal-body rod protein FlgB [Amphiplicatus metriothermophilus]SNT68334.1 flagellar basal-body rod protein FlgB [Amphiplicatus metriothermophilus]